MRFSVSKRSIISLLNSWVNPSVATGTSDHAEHVRFIGLNLLVAALSLVATPILLAFSKFTPASLLLQGGFVILPLALLVWVSRTAKLETAKIAALLGLSVSIATIIVALDFPVTFALLALTVVPIEAVLWRCNKALTSGTVGVLLGLTLVMYFEGNATPIVSVETVSGWFAILALLYGTGVAWRVHDANQKLTQRMARENAQLETLSQSSTDLITRHSRDGSTLFASPESRSHLGVSSKELIGAGLFEKIHLQDRIIFLKAISDVAHSGRDQQCEIRLRYKGGTDQLWKKMRVTARGLSNAETGATEVVCTIRDISRECDLEAELELALHRTGQFSHSQRQFLAKMSHELRTPLNAIVGFSDVLQQELFGKLPHERHREYVKLIQDSGQHLLCVVNDLLDMSRIESGKYELSLSEFDFRSVVINTTGMLKPLADKKSIEVQYDVNAGLENITADRRACQQILINLVSNAIKFSDDSGKIRIKVKPYGRSFKIQVSDEGVGITPEFLPKVGEPFVQADNGNNRQYEGSGLGLSVVKGLVELHQGEFKIQSTEGDGTTVTVILPIRCRVSRPVPGNVTDQLVQLDNPTTEQSEDSKLVTSSVNKGESRARLSA